MYLKLNIVKWKKRRLGDNAKCCYFRACINEGSVYVKVEYLVPRSSLNVFFSRKATNKLQSAL